MKLFNNLFILLFLHFSFSLFSQDSTKQTLGLFINQSEAFDGYTLINGLHHKTTYLINNCGQTVHTWPPNNYNTYTAIMDEKGNLYRVTNANTTSPFPGQGRIEKTDWNGNLLWEYIFRNEKVSQHHSIKVMPNGNILMIAYEYKSKEEAIKNGRIVDKNTPPDAVLDGQVYPDKILEIKPRGKNKAKIVWEWQAWDHLIQDYDESKLNYGNVQKHPELIHINYPKQNLLDPDWMHANCIDYNPETDQILLSVRNWSEIWIIDHSTSTKEASKHKGGKYGKGGDLLYRFGNPEAYNNGDINDQMLFFQHDAHWIPKNLNGGGNIMIFNNAVQEERSFFSNIIELKPINPTGENKNPYLIYQPEWKYQPSVNDSFFSSRMSSAQRLPNGNTLIAEGEKGNIFEINKKNEIVWKYIVPLLNGEPMTQGEKAFDNKIFNAEKYPKNLPAFIGKDLTPKGYIELNPLNYPCPNLPK